MFGQIKKSVVLFGKESKVQTFHLLKTFAIANIFLVNTDSFTKALNSNCFITYHFKFVFNKLHLFIT